MTVIRMRTSDPAIAAWYQSWATPAPPPSSIEWFKMWGEIKPPVEKPKPPVEKPKPPVEKPKPPVQDGKPVAPETADDITEQDMSNLIKYVSDDYFEGRRTASKKGNEFAGWLAKAFEQRGLKGGGTKGSFFQQVSDFGDNNPMVSTIFTEAQSPNVIGVLEGSDPKLKNEYIIYTAHWDHLGKKTNAKPGEDAIYNGAVDNGSGIAMLLELAEKFKKNPPKRSVIFVGFTGEEEGLYGSQAFAEKLESGELGITRDGKFTPIQSYQLVGGLNIDENIPHTKGKDMAVAGYGIPANTSNVTDILKKQVNAQKRQITPDPSPEERYYERSDHYSLVERLGIPMIFPLNTREDLDDFEGKLDNAPRYHQPSDEWDPNWLKQGKMGGVVEDAVAYYNFGQELANTNLWPTWDARSPYKLIRELDLARRALA